MKQFVTKVISILVFCLSLLSTTHSVAQCYTQLIDASGITLESKDIQALKDSACELRKVFPEALRDSFSVIDLGFYALTDDTEGGIAEFTRMAEDALRENPSTKYYLLFGRQSDSKNGPNSKIFIKLKLPTWGNFKCMTDMEKSLFQIRLELEIEKRPIVMPDTYVRIEEDVMRKMRAMVKKVVDCCYAGRGCTQDCGNEIERRSIFFKIGMSFFSKISVIDVKPYQKVDVDLGNLTNKVFMFSDITIKTEDDTHKLSDKIMYWLNSSQNKNHTYTIIVTSNPDCCESTSQYEQIYDNSESDIKIWYNIEGQGNDMPILLKFDYKDNPPITINNGTVNLNGTTPPPSINYCLIELYSGKILALKQHEEFKTPIYYVDELEYLYNRNNPWYHARNLRNPVGKDAKDFQGIKGISFWPNHPLYPKKPTAIKYDDFLYYEDLLDVTENFRYIVKAGLEEFKHKCTFIGVSPNLGLTNIMTTGCFWNLVTDDAKFDLKSKSPNKGTPCYAAICIGPYAILDGYIRRYDDFGNISYAMFGKKCGFFEQTLLVSSNINQLGKSGNDELRDVYMINLGFEFYKNDYLHISKP